MATRRTFRGRDRRIITKMKKTIELAEARDLKAANPRRTSAISTREKMFPTSDTSLVAAVAAVKARLVALLAMTTTT